MCIQTENTYILPEDYAGNDVLSSPDELNGSPAENKAIFDRLVKNVVVPKHNLLAEKQADTYTKAEVNSAIQTQLTAIGAGDMAKNIYDKTGTVAAAGGIESAIKASAVNTGYSLYSHSKTGNTHYLTGTGPNIKFKSDGGPYVEGDLFCVNGVETGAFMQDGQPLPNNYFIQHAVVSCFLNGAYLNFKSGGSALAMDIIIVPSAAALPAVAAINKNTIAIVSTTPFPASGRKWCVGAKEFGSPQTGATWVYSDSANVNRNMNVLGPPNKNGFMNNIYVYPTLCRQWNGSAFVNKEAYSFRPGEDSNWVGMFLAIYTAGTWGNYGKFFLSWSNYGSNSVTETPSYYQFNGTGAANAKYELPAQLDLTGRKTIVFDYQFTGGQNSSIGVISGAAKTTLIADNVRREARVDISALGGLQNILISLDTTSTFTLRMYNLKIE